VHYDFTRQKARRHNSGWRLSESAAAPTQSADGMALCGHADWEMMKITMGFAITLAAHYVAL